MRFQNLLFYRIVTVVVALCMLTTPTLLEASKGKAYEKLTNIQKRSATNYNLTIIGGAVTVEKYERNKYSEAMNKAATVDIVSGEKKIAKMSVNIDQALNDKGFKSAKRKMLERLRDPKQSERLRAGGIESPREVVQCMELAEKAQFDMKAGKSPSSIEAKKLKECEKTYRKLIRTEKSRNELTELLPHKLGVYKMGGNGGSPAGIAVDPQDRPCEPFWVKWFRTSDNTYDENFRNSYEVEPKEDEDCFWNTTGGEVLDVIIFIIICIVILVILGLLCILAGFCPNIFAGDDEDEEESLPEIEERAPTTWALTLDVGDGEEEERTPGTDISDEGESGTEGETGTDATTVDFSTYSCERLGSLRSKVIVVRLYDLLSLIDAEIAERCTEKQGVCSVIDGAPACVERNCVITGGNNCSDHCTDGEPLSGLPSDLCGEISATLDGRLVGGVKITDISIDCETADTRLFNQCLPIRDDKGSIINWTCTSYECSRDGDNYRSVTGVYSTPPAGFQY